MLSSIREEFPICRLEFPVMGGQKTRPLIYLDHGATTHPPRRVLSAFNVFVEHYYANIHRGNYNLSMIATDMFDRVEETVLGFIGADPRANTVVLTTNTTGALDLASYLFAGIEGVTLSTVLEHHSNFLPHRRRGETLLADCHPDGSLDYEDVEKKLKGNRVKLLAVTGASNVTGYMPRIHHLARMAHQHGAMILVDAAQLLAHHAIDVKPDSDPEHVDLLAAAGHKACAPFGSAFLYGPRSLFDSVPPCVPGGGTVEFVTPEKVLWARSPDRHQGGTPNIPGAIALAESLKFLKEIGLEEIRRHERELYTFALGELAKIDGITIYGPRDPGRCIGVITFNVDGIPNELVAAILNYEGAVATRNGCFCAHPYLHRLLNVQNPLEYKTRFDHREIMFLPGAVRATMGIYNNREEIEEFLRMVKVIAKRQWKGEYDLATASHCHPIRFTATEPSNGNARCLLDQPAESQASPGQAGSRLTGHHI